MRSVLLRMSSLLKGKPLCAKPHPSPTPLALVQAEWLCDVRCSSVVQKNYFVLSSSGQGWPCGEKGEAINTAITCAAQWVPRRVLSVNLLREQVKTGLTNAHLHTIGEISVGVLEFLSYRSGAVARVEQSIMFWSISVMNCFFFKTVQKLFYKLLFLSNDV